MCSDLHWSLYLGLKFEEYRSKLELNYWKAIQLSSRWTLAPNSTITIKRAEFDFVGKYLVCGDSFGGISLYDLKNNLMDGTGSKVSLQSIKRTRNNGHRAGVSSIGWYPVDNGAFYSSSLDGKVCIWDTNQFTTAGSFDIGGQVYAASIGNVENVATSVIAAGASTGVIKLCDLRSGTCYHSIHGHRSQVFGVEWNRWQGAGFMLVSASSDGCLLLWDTRKSGYGPLLAFNGVQEQHSAFSSTSIASSSSSSVYGKSSDKVGVKAHNASILGLKISTCGNFIISLDRRAIKVWNIHTGQLTVCAYHAANRAPNENVALPVQMECIRVGSSSDNDLVAFPSEQGRIFIAQVHPTNTVVDPIDRCFNIFTPIATLQGHLKPVSAVASVLDRSDYTLLSCGQDGLSLFWERPIQNDVVLDMCDRKYIPGRVTEDTWSDDENTTTAEAYEPTPKKYKRPRRVQRTDTSLIRDGSGLLRHERVKPSETSSSSSQVLSSSTNSVRNGLTLESLAQFDLKRLLK